MPNGKFERQLIKSSEQKPNGHTIAEAPQIVDMELFLKRVAPIEGVFSPDEEVQKLWSVPKEQRKEAVSAFKDKLARQREAWALCRTTIEQRIEANPDIPRKEMVEIIGQFASHYGFAEQHIKLAEQLVDDYISARKRVMEAREKYPDDIALINHLTGMQFTEADSKDFRVVIAPMSIDILTTGLNVGRIIHKRSENPVPGAESVGFTSQSKGENLVYFVVINADSALTNYRGEIQPHEHEHVKNRLLRPRLYPVEKIRSDVRQRLSRGLAGFLRHRIYKRFFRFERISEQELFIRYQSERDPERKIFFLEEYMRLARGTALNQAKDEIVALFKLKDGGLLFPGALDYIFFSKYSDSYDYLKDLRDWGKKKNDPLWQETAQRVLVDEYRAIIKNAVSQFKELVAHDYTIEEAIALLTDKSLSDWPKTVRRQLEAKKTRE